MTRLTWTASRFPLHVLIVNLLIIICWKSSKYYLVAIISTHTLLVHFAHCMLDIDVQVVHNYKQLPANMVHIEQNKISLCLLILSCFLNHALCAHSISSQNQNININNDILIGVGIILNMESPMGKAIHSCITMAISDFYALRHSYKTRIVIHTRDSEGDPDKALSSGTLSI